jgi:predicted extracellular nuclease
MTLLQKRKSIIFSVFAITLFLVSLFPISAQGYSVVTIPEIQGGGWESPYKWQWVETTGIVTADYQWESKRGFFIQDPVGDGNSSTSDGIFVYERYDVVDLGDQIVLRGKVTEYYGLTEIYPVESITILSSDNDLPEPVELDPPFDDYDSDVYYESLEGMLVSVPDMKVVAGTNQYGECAGVRPHLGVNRVFEDDPQGTGELIFTDDAGGFELNVRSGWLVKGLSGPLDYTYDEYKVLPASDAKIKVIPKGSGIGLGRGRAENNGLTVATYNMFNLFDDSNAEYKLAKHAWTIHNLLREPDLIAVQEAEELDLLERLAETKPIKASYEAVLIEGPDARGIDVGLLYRADRVTVLSAEARQTNTTLDDGYGPGEGLLFSRPPLVVHLEVLDADGLDLWLIINHFKSKGQYPPYYADTTPRRVEQAEWVVSLVEEIQIGEPQARVVVLGDLNDFECSEPLETLEDSGLINLIWEVRKADRYTYIYRGVSEVLDHILVTQSMEDLVDEVLIVHSNTDFPEPLYGDDSSIGFWSTDHDILIAAFDLNG